MDQSILHGLLKGIFAFEMPITRIEGKRKMSQNKLAEDQISTISGLRTMNEPQSTAVANEMESGLPKPIRCL